MADEPNNLILEQLRAIRGAIDALGTRIGAVETQGVAHTTLLAGLQQDVRMVRAAINDISRVNVTAGEIEAMHTELTRIQGDVAAHGARLDRIERSEP
jgi:ubiquinone biosynthesis protein UbiJ